MGGGRRHSRIEGGEERDSGRCYQLCEEEHGCSQGYACLLYSVSVIEQLASGPLATPSTFFLFIFIMDSI